MKFLTGTELADDIYDTIFYTEKYLLIISPFIQLDEYFKNEVFKTHINNSNVHIILGFGKNEGDVNRSFKRTDIEFFTKFPNITIVYIPTLHAKYYGNEKKSIVTSMNLIDYSFKNNIEFGVVSERKILGNNKFFDSSQNKCFNIVEDEGFTIFVKRPIYKKKFLRKDYVGSEVELDIINSLERGESIDKINFSKFGNEKYINFDLKESRNKREVSEVNIGKEKNESVSSGCCIRCGVGNSQEMDRPLCFDCYTVWLKYSNPHFEENYCLVCGKRERTSFSEPRCLSCRR